MFAEWQRQATDFQKQWEEAAGRWWDDHLRDPKTLDAMGQLLGGLSTLKERGDRALEDHWGRWRLPSAADVERLYERMGEVEESLARIEDLLLEGQEARTRRPATSPEAGPAAE